MADRDLWKAVAERYDQAWGEVLLGVAAYGSRARGCGSEDSDHDILVVCTELPADPFERRRAVRRPLKGLEQAAMVHVLARTRGEFLSDVTALHLDLALDAIVLLERDEFLSRSLGRVRDLISMAGLRRDPDLGWSWIEQPSVADWAIRWDGVRV